MIERSGPANLLNYGEWDGQTTPRAENLKSWLEKAGFEVAITATPHVEIWTKLTQMVSCSGVATLTRQPLRACAEHPGTHELLREAMTEIMAIAAARGVTVPADTADKTMAAIANIDPNWRTSMGNDREAGKPLEVETLSGAVYRMGQQLGVPTPVNGVIYRALRQYASTG